MADNEKGEGTPEQKPEDSPKQVDQFAERIGTLTRQRHDAERKAEDEAKARADAEARAAAAEAELQAEREAREEHERKAQIAQKQSEISSKYPNAAKFLEENPELGIAGVETVEQYDERMGKLEQRLSGGVQPPVAEQKKEEGNDNSFVANPAQGQPTQPNAPVSAQDVAQMPYQQYAQLSPEQRNALLRGEQG